MSMMLLPSHDLDESAGLRNARFGVEHARISCVVEVRRHAVILRVSQHVSQLAFGRFSHRLFHFFVRRRFIDPEAISWTSETFPVARTRIELTISIEHDGLIPIKCKLHQ